MDSPLDAKYLLITGATGLIGHYLLAELLRRGRRCVVLLRYPLSNSRARLARLLSELQIDIDDEVAAARLVVLGGNVNETIGNPGVPLDAVVHLAAATRFTADPTTGDPWKTNVHGTERLLEFMATVGVANLHLISSAYVCGKTTGEVGEHIDVTSRTFHNDYEASKLTAELSCARWAAEGIPQRRKLTIYRPSIVVGDRRTGRSTRFNGFYLLARATELLSRSMSGADCAARHSVQLRIRGNPSNRQNIVPVDYVACAIASVIGSQGHHGRVYHLVHPNPPTNQQIKEAMEHCFDLAGGQFVDPAAFEQNDLNEWERSFYDVSRPIEHYFIDTPTFARTNADEIDRAFNLTCPEFTRDSIDRLVRHAICTNWGRRQKGTGVASSSCAVYFEQFLPARILKSRVARMTALSVTVRFIIDDEADGQWVCQFERGRLIHVHRGSNSFAEDFAYRSNRAAFWKAVSGRVHPQELFLDGDADITGNVEQALKMAMILHAFTREFPCDRQTLVEESQRFSANAISGS